MTRQPVQPLDIDRFMAKLEQELTTQRLGILALHRLTLERIAARLERDLLNTEEVKNAQSQG